MKCKSYSKNNELKCNDPAAHNTNVAVYIIIDVNYLFTSESKYFFILSNSNPLIRHTKLANILILSSSSINNFNVDNFIIKYGNNDNIATIDSDDIIKDYICLVAYILNIHSLNNNI